MNEKDLGPNSSLKEGVYLRNGYATIVKKGKPNLVMQESHLKKFNERKEKKKEVFELISALKELNYDDEISLEVIDNLEKTLKTII